MSVVKRESIQIIIKKMMKSMKGIEKKKKIIQIQYNYNAVFLGGCYVKEKKRDKTDVDYRS